MANNIDWAQFVPDESVAPAGSPAPAAPAAPTATTDWSQFVPEAPAEKPGLLRHAADLGLEFVQGGTGVIGALSSGLFGAPDAEGYVSGRKNMLEANPIGVGAGVVSKYAMDLQSDSRKADRAADAARMQAAEATGSTWEEIKAGATNFAESPLAHSAQALGSMAPTVAAAFLSGGAAIPAALGGVIGMGSVKEQISERIKREGATAGLTPEQAAVRADAAQAYTGENIDQIALGAGLGVLAGGTGVERMLGGGIPVKNAVGRFLTGAVTEAIPEGAQGGQERLAANIAAQREGYGGETWTGVAGQATTEALASAGPGGVMGALNPAAGPISRAAIQAQQQQAAGALPAPGQLSGAAAVPMGDNVPEGDPSQSYELERQKTELEGARRQEEARRAGEDLGYVDQINGWAPGTALAGASERLAELDLITQGTPDQQVPGPDGKPVTIPGTVPRFFTAEEQAEYAALAKAIDNTRKLQPAPAGEAAPSGMDTAQDSALPFTQPPYGGPAPDLAEQGNQTADPRIAIAGEPIPDPAVQMGVDRPTARQQYLDAQRKRSSGELLSQREAALLSGPDPFEGQSLSLAAPTDEISTNARQEAIEDVAFANGDQPADVSVYSAQDLPDGPAGNERGAGLTRAAASVIEGLGRIFGTEYRFFDSPNSAQLGDGFVLRGRRPGVAYVRAVEGATTPLVVAGHETYHTFAPEERTRFSKAIEPYVDVSDTAQLAFLSDYTGGRYQTKITQLVRSGVAPAEVIDAILAQAQQGGGPALSRAVLREEFDADIFGNRMKDTAFWDKVFTELKAQDRGLLVKIRDSIKQTIQYLKGQSGKLRGFNTDQYVRDLDAVQQIAARTLLTRAARVKPKSAAGTRSAGNVARTTQRGRIGPFATVSIAEGSRAWYAKKGEQFSVQQTDEGVFLLPVEGEQTSLDTAGGATLATDSVTQPGQDNGQARSDTRGSDTDAGRDRDAQPVRDGNGTATESVVPEYGKPRENAIAVVGTHYSRQVRGQLNSAFYGSGLKGAEADRLRSADPRLRQRIYFYVDTGKGITPEDGVGSQAHEVKLNNIYDAAADPLDLKARDLSVFEAAVLDAGFDGYLARSFGNNMAAVVLLGNHNVGVKHVGQGSRTPSGRSLPEPVLSPQKQLVQRVLGLKNLPGGEVSARRWGTMLLAADPEAHAMMNEAGVFNSDDVMYRAELLGRYQQAMGGVRRSPPRKQDTLSDHPLEIEREIRALADKTHMTRAELTQASKDAREFGFTPKEVELEIRRIKARFPVDAGWAPITFSRIDKKTLEKKATEQTPLPADALFFEKIPYGFHQDAKGKADKKSHDERVTKLGRALADEIKAQHEAALAGNPNAQRIMLQSGWYRELRSKLRQVFGGFADYLAQLLGPTSANNPVEPNFRYATEALFEATSGRWDDIIKESITWQADIKAAAARLDAVEGRLSADQKRDLKAFSAEVTERFGKGNKSDERTAFIEEGIARISPDLAAARQGLKDASVFKGREPLRDNGKRFGMATKGVLEILAESWGTKRPGDAPKTKNYYQNIIGRTIEATIDVWAARTLRRLADEHVGKFPRIPGPAEQGVAGNILKTGTDVAGSEFGFGQAVFNVAAEELRASGIDTFQSTNASEIQAMIWFAEKEVWARRDWTTKIGEGGSIEHELLLAGYMDRGQLNEWRVAARAGQPKQPSTEGVPAPRAAQILAKWEADVAKWRDAKDAAASAMNEVARYPDRYFAGATSEIPNDVPLDQELAALGREIEETILAEPGVMAVRAQSSTGVFMDDRERTLDIEAVVRNGYDATPLADKLREVGDREGQQATFLSRVLRADEAVDFLRHRPGLELYFSEQISPAKAEELIAVVQEAGFIGMTLATEGRRTPGALGGETQNVVGIRVQHIPEFMLGYGYTTEMSDADLVSTSLAAMRDLVRLRKQLNERADISTAEIQYYETEVNFYGDGARANSNVTGRDSGGSAARRRSGGWQGVAIREGLANADRFNQERREDALTSRRDRIREERSVRRRGAESEVGLRRSSQRTNQALDSVAEQGDGVLRSTPRLAPNGKPSKLTEQQWQQVRTPEFKAWFGDWEAFATQPYGVWADDQGVVSKVVDPDTGEPKVVYHGSPTAGFTVFQSPRNGRGVTGSFFTDHRPIAGTYSGPRAGETNLDLEDDREPGIYSVFLNIRDPGEENFDGANWDGTRTDQYQVVDENGDTIYSEDGRGIFDRDGAEVLAAENPGSEIQEADDFWTSTDGVVVEASQEGRDGAIIHDVVDNGGRGDVWESSTVYVAFEPEQIKSAVGNSGAFDSADPDIRRSPNRLGFYSQLQRAVEDTKFRVQPAGQWKSWLAANANKVGVRAGEIQWSGITDWLDMQGENRVTKAEISAYLAEGGVQIEEVSYGSTHAWAQLSDEALRAEYERVRGYPAEAYGEPMSRQAILEELQDALPENTTTTKYANWRTPGGENYREVLLTLPAREPRDLNSIAQSLYGKNFSDLGDEAANAVVSAERQEKKRQNYQSGHWRGTPNVLAHIRLDDRRGANSERILFVQELQSDWAQDGRKKGFSDARDRDKARIKELLTQHTALNDRIRAENRLPTDAEAAEFARINDEDARLRAAVTRAGTGGIPAAPFVTDTKAWVALGIKRIITMAAEQGYDQVALVSGAQAAEMFRLDKQVDQIAYNKGSKFLRVLDKDGDTIFNGSKSPEELPDLLGKEVAERIMATEGNFVQLEGEGLKIEAAGMRGFYDKIVPQVANDVLKKLGGGKVAPIQTAGSLVPIAHEGSWIVQDPKEGHYYWAEGTGSRWTKSRNRATKYPSAETAAADVAWIDNQPGTTQLGFDITPAMREKVQAEGVPLFSTRRAEKAFGAITAAQEAALRATGLLREPKTIKERFDELTRDAMKRLVQGTVDQYAPLRELDFRSYVIARMSKGSDGTFEATLRFGKPVVRGDTIEVDTSTGGLMDVFSSLSGEQDRFLAWIAANRAEQLTNEGKEFLFTPDQIRDLKQLNTGAMADGRNRQMEYARALKEFNAFQDAVLGVAEARGLIDAESRQVWKDAFYVPFYRNMEDGTSGPSVKSGLVNQYAFKKLKGSQRQLNEDLLANTLQNMAHLLSASAKNHAASSSLRAAESAGVAHRVPSGTKGAVRFLAAGREQHYIVDDPFILDAITSLEAVKVVGLEKVLSKFKHWLTLGVTVNPTFQVRSLMRDMLSALAITNIKMNPIANVVQGIGSQIKQDQDHINALASGGLIRFNSLVEGNRADYTRKLIRQGVRDSSILDTQEKITGFFSQALDKWMAVGDIGESTNRMALYKQQIAAGVDPLLAAYQSRDMMDFSMQGQWRAIRFLTQVVPFLNARMQGLYKLGRDGVVPTGRVLFGGGSATDKQIAKRFGAVTGAVAMASILLMAAYRDDEDWKKREDWDRDTYWWFKIGDTAYRIPKPFEVGAIGTIAERAAEMFMADDMTGGRFLSRLGHMMSSTFALNPIPQMVKPLLDVYANENSFTRRPIESMGMERLQAKDRFTGSTSEVARWLGQLGLPEPGRLMSGQYQALSPVQIDSLIQGYFSWLGVSATRIVDLGVRAVADRPARPEMQLRDVFFAGNFVETLPANASRYVTTLYEQSKAIESAYASYRFALRQGDQSRAQELLTEEGDKIRLNPLVTRAKQTMAKLNENIRVVERDMNLSPAEKRAHIDRIKALQNQIAMRVSARF